MRPKERLLRRGKIPNDESAIRNALEAWSDRLSHWTEFFTFLVVSGLIIEYLPDITYFLRFVLVPLAASVQGHAEQLRQFGGFLVIAGVAGELWIEVRASRVETDLREETGKIISETNERAARAEQATAELNNENLKLRRAILPRVIVFGNRDGDTQARQARLAEVREYSGTKVLIESVSGNEPETLSLNIVELLRQSNWNVVRFGPTIPPGLLTSGVRIMTREESPFRSDGIPLGSEYRFSEISKAARALEDFLLLDLGPPFGPPFWGVRWDPQYPNPNTGKYRAEFPKDVIAVAIGDIPIEYSVTPIPPPYPDSNAK